MSKRLIYRNILCPAKLNLILRIDPPRKDGFHPLESLMVPMAFGDSLTLVAAKAKGPLYRLQLKCPGVDFPQEQNLVYKVARRFCELSKLPLDLRFHLKKVVPTGAGLGGGSSDAATALLLLARAAKTLFKKDVAFKTLHKIAAQFGSDIPFFLYESAAWCTGRGEKCVPLKLRSLAIVLVLPKKISVPTPWAYRTLDAYPERQRQKVFLPGRPRWLKEPFDVPELINDFEGPIFSEKPALQAFKTALARAGASAALMSGSGSTLFGVFSSPAAAKTAAKSLKRTLKGRAEIVSTQTLRGL